MPTPSVPMPLRSFLALLAFGAIAVTGVVTLLLTGLPISQELSLLTVLIVVGIFAAVGLAAFIGRLFDRERQEVQSAARSELQASVRRFGEALRLTSVDADGEPDLAPLLRVVLETAISAVDGRRGIVYRFERAHNRLDPVSTVNVDVAAPLDANARLAGRIASHRTSLMIPGGPAFAEIAGAEPQDRVAIGVPLESGDDLLGVLTVHGRLSGGTFGERDLDTLALLASQASIGAENVLLHHEARRLSVTDGLTGLANYRAFRERLATEFERAVRFGRPLSLAIVDIDHFKQFNDRFGHQCGDAVLAELAARMTASTRTAIDLVARYGGEEFAVLLPETGPAGAHAVSEKIRAAAAQTPFVGGDQHLHTTVSVGFATFPEHANDPDGLVQAADLALYEAKRAGRNRVGAASASKQPQRDA